MREARMGKKIKMPLGASAPAKNAGSKPNQQPSQMEEIAKRYQ